MSQVSATLLREMRSRAEAATRGTWRPVGKSVLAGETVIAEAALPDRGTAQDARHNAAHIASASPDHVLALLNEVSALRIQIADEVRLREEAEARTAAAEQDAARARGVLGAVTLPRGEAADRSIREILDEIAAISPEAGAKARDLAAIARSGVHDRTPAPLRFPQD